ncbi:putative disease resistance protein At3g14460 [Ziziphus jujuba]|uniref:Disease resistance protein At3g14460 n=1 Tax=Ziziphus jujuba TaxID=326968 RepID=A0ABM4A2F7_ZIZJJ|nr:putative disease resistance protein At3g14460 [Ziziphus jujuba]
MGGIGKTTLARLVYNDVKVKKNFDLKAWVTVSDEFDVFKLTKTIFDQIISGQKDCNIKHPDQLQYELKKVIEGKKFLFVFDDVWNKNYNLWNNLKSQFKFGASGSKIIVTTRDQNIGSAMGTFQNHYLQIISDEDSWQLFAKHAFQQIIDRSALQEFEEIGRGIVRKCNGLPLAIKSLGGLLCSKNRIDEWEDILNSDIWKLQCDILPALWLSYHYLPSHLRQCFAYCSIFPKDYKFEKEKLILLWMAEDLLQPQQDKTLEEIGEEYFNDLTSRSFFHQNEHGCFTMHDLVNDLATFVSREFCLRFDDGYSKVFTGKTRHLSCMTYVSHDMKNLEEYLSKNKVLRTFLFQSRMLPKQFLTNLEQYLKPMRCLRVLSLRQSCVTTGFDLIGSLKLLKYIDLSHTEIEELPDTIYTLYNLQTFLLNTCKHLHRLSSSIGNLKHLRFLDLSHCSKIEEIPNTLCDLKDLRTLNLMGCQSLSCLPADMSRLVNLCYLDFSNTKVTKMPLQICELKRLQHLEPAFLVDHNGGRNIKDLGNLQDLRGSFWIKNIENIINVGDVSKAKLKDKRHITCLRLEWCGETDDSEKSRVVLEKLQPHTNVQDLRIWNYQGTGFPSWIGHHSFSHIVSLYLLNCKNCYLLPSLGQLPSLKDLNIWGLEMVERIGDEFYSCSSISIGSSSMINTPVPFKSLEILYLGDLRELREWKEWSLMMGGDVGGSEGTGAFPQLRKLSLRECPNINGACLPCNLPSSTTLQIFSGCQQVVASLQSDQLPWLGELQLIRCSELESFPPQGGLPTNIHTIQILGCEKLESLAKKGWPSNLKSLEICDCKNLFMDVGSFPEEGQLPTTLTCLKLESLPKLKTLNGKALRDMVCLQQLTIDDCRGVQCLVEEGLPDSLSELNIIWCNSLIKRCQRDTGEDWPKIAHIPHIEITADLCISGLDMVERIRDEFYYSCSSTSSGSSSMINEPEPVPFKYLESLYLGILRELREWKKWSIMKMMGGDVGKGDGMAFISGFLVNWSHLFGDMDSFTEDGQLPTTLTCLDLNDLPKLKSLNGKALRDLVFLQQRTIDFSGGVQCLPEEGLPDSLSELNKQGCHSSVADRCKRDTGEEIAHIAHVNIWPCK